MTFSLTNQRDQRTIELRLKLININKAAEEIAATYLRNN